MRSNNNCGVFTVFVLVLSMFVFCKNAKAAEPGIATVILYTILGKLLLDYKPVIPRNTSVENRQNCKLLYNKLYDEKTIEDLIFLSAIDNLYTEIDCIGINTNSVIKLINAALMNKKKHLEATIRQQQIWASIGSFLQQC